MIQKRLSDSKTANRAATEWLEAFKSQLQPYLERGDYKGALPLVESALKDYPKEFIVRFNYAKILGDWADELPPARKKKMKAQSIRILKPLVRSLAGQPVATRFSVSLNYYYQSEDWTSMYAFGRRFVRHDRQRAFYAQGIAGALIAYDLMEAKQFARSKSWAKKAVAAWEKYDLKNEPYYFAAYNYAKSLALAGQKKEALVALKRAAKQGKRPITDWEFADVLKLIQF